ncbi:hypothetical protein [Confluentibacter sediminis]|uniref:hypothetical protein n=1 Tax=Confluentibacter sediminis TaxID=2219045 RepID=UPI0013A6E1F1|nr:hypothetical protein [Confluentibacter sediminis]
MKLPEPNPNKMQNVQQEAKSIINPNNFEISFSFFTQFSKPKLGFLIDFSEVL